MHWRLHQGKIYFLFDNFYSSRYIAKRNKDKQFFCQVIPSQDYHCGFLCLCQEPRLCKIQTDLWWCQCSSTCRWLSKWISAIINNTLDCRHGSHFRPGCWRCDPFPLWLCRRCHHHHTQEPKGCEVRCSRWEIMLTNFMQGLAWSFIDGVKKALTRKEIQ